MFELLSRPLYKEANILSLGARFLGPAARTAAPAVARTAGGLVDDAARAMGGTARATARTARPPIAPNFVDDLAGARAAPPPTPRPTGPVPDPINPTPTVRPGPGSPVPGPIPRTPSPMPGYPRPIGPTRGNMPPGAPGRAAGGGGGGGVDWAAIRDYMPSGISNPLNYLPTGLRRHLGYTAGGAFTGALPAMHGEEGMVPGGLLPNMIAGALAFNPRLGRGLTRTRGVSALNVPLQGIRGGMTGYLAGDILDTASSLGGLGDPGTRHTARMIGGTAGLLRGVPGAMRPFNRGARAATGGGPSRGQMWRDGLVPAPRATVGRGVGQFGAGMMRPFAYPGQVISNIYNSRPLLAGVRSTVGRTAAGARGAGVGTIASVITGGPRIVNSIADRFSGRVLNNAIDAGREVVPGLMERGMNTVEDRMDAYLAERGLLDENGQFSMTGGRGGMMSRLDGLLQRMGLDVSRMSAPQKLMIIGGALGLGGGALTGSPALAGLGALGMGAGFLPGMGGRGVTERETGASGHPARAGIPALPEEGSVPFGPRNELDQQFATDQNRGSLGWGGSTGR